MHNKPHTEESKRKIREHHKGMTGKKHSDETREKMSKNNGNFWLGKKMSEESNKKRSDALKGDKNHNYGKHFSEERKKKMSEMAKKRIGKLASMFGKHHSKETIEKMSGKNCHFWKGGIMSINDKIRHSIEYKLWRKSVFERDNYTCIFCGKGNKNGERTSLQADHIRPFASYPELRFAIDNGRTLCIECHRKTDTYCRKLK